jgi:hypothetical protein
MAIFLEITLNYTGGSHVADTLTQGEPLPSTWENIANTIFGVNGFFVLPLLALLNGSTLLAWLVNTIFRKLMTSD